MKTSDAIDTLSWVGDVDGHLTLIDQTLLPTEFRVLACHDVDCVWEAIRNLRIRGAPAIGLAAAYGVILGVRDSAAKNKDEFFTSLQRVTKYLASSRPTAVNLFWALDRLNDYAGRLCELHDPKAIVMELLAEARRMHDEDRAMCRAIGRYGAELLKDGQGVLTHCNAGGLATSDYGTALAVLFTCHEQGKKLAVYVDETRPLLQGARLTAWELIRRGITTTLICDSMAAQVMKEGRIQAVVVGADRIAGNGDTANKIGTYGVAVLARAHRIPFYVAAPTNTLDLSLSSGNDIPIEQRDQSEVTRGFGRQTAPDGVAVYNPAFDVTPAEFIDAIITERGIFRPGQILELASTALTPRPFRSNLRQGADGGTGEPAWCSPNPS